MKKTIARLIVFFVGLPAIAVIIVFLPHLSHLAINAIIVVVSALGTHEFIEILRKRGIQTSRLIMPATALVAVATYFYVLGSIANIAYLSLLIAPFLLVVSSATFKRYHGDFSKTLAEISGTIAAVVYPTYFIMFLILIAGLPYPTLSFVCFLSMVFANDTSAYVFGMLFGRSSRGVSEISPNKSLPGFIAGPIFSMIVALLFFRFAPELFDSNLLVAIVVGALVGAATVFGDLFESALKRSAGVKDSGILIPGRGGILDSIDSVAFAAPIFYLLISFVR